MKKIILIVVVIAALGTAGTLAYRSLHPEITNRIVISGNIELTQVDIAFKTSGRLIERTVNEGDPVQKGMVIARLDREQLLHQRETAEAALGTAQAQLAESISALKWQRETMQADMQLRNADLSAAQSQLLQLKKALIFTGLSVPTDFPLNSSGGTVCAYNTTLVADSFCTLPIDFTPLSTGLLNAESYTLTDNNLNVSLNVQSIALSATGNAAPDTTATTVLISPNTGLTTSASSTTTVTATVTDTGGVRGGPAGAAPFGRPR